MKSGVLLVLEGTDGSGKTTQFNLLSERLRAAGHDVAIFDFPRYDSESSYFVRQYLNGAYGQATRLSPYAASMFYALDRFEAASSIKEALKLGKVVLCNRYTGSNMAHQGSKFVSEDEKKDFFIWLDSLEFQVLGVPRPRLNIVLKMPAEAAQKLIGQKNKRSYTDKSHDQHEADIEHQRQTVATYDLICSLFPKDFIAIECVDAAGAILSIPAISNLIWQNLKPILPPRSASAKAAPRIVHLNAKPALVSQNKNGSFSITEEGRKYLESIVTSVDGDVYSFTDKLSSVTIAAAMARLSRRGDDMRVTLLDEFVSDTGQDQELLKRVITAYGDDSVQQLVGLHVVVEGASNLLTKKLEWGRLGAYLEQSTRYIYFDQKDSRGHFKYYIPNNLQGNIRRQYRADMDRIFKNYSQLVRKLTDYIEKKSSIAKTEQDGAWRSACRAQACDAARALLPVATKSTVGIYASGQALENLIMHLMSDELDEARHAGEQILKQSRKIIPVFLERADKPERGGAAIAYLANTRAAVLSQAHQLLPQTLSEPIKAVQLTSVWPHNELDLIADMLYEHSNLPLRDIRAEVEKWSYPQKQEVFKSYMGERLNRRHRPGRALEKAHYSWDLLCDYGIFRDLQRHRMVDDLAWQTLTPRYGYDIPPIVETAGLGELFEACFDISLKLHGRLLAQEHELEAQYATLLGHKLRWKVTYNAREAFHLHELRTSPQGHPGYRKLVMAMHQQLAQVHPLMAEAMIFVNKDEDPELSRLGAERYTHYKLLQLEKTKQNKSV